MPTLNRNGGLLTYRVAGQDKDTCLGYLFDFTGHGVFDPIFGKVEVTHEEADAHNKALSEAELKGLDNCQVGQGGTFYYVNGAVQTFVGTPVTFPSLVKVNGNTITFQRGMRIYRGRLQKDADCFNFKRIS